MAIENLSAFIALILAVSLASERLVTVLKTALPKFLSEESGAGSQAVDPVTDRPRRLSVQLLAFAASWITAGFISEGGGLNVLGWQPLGHVAVSASQSMPAWIVGILGSGGSALWNNLLGYSKAAKDIRIQDRLASTLDNVGKAANLGLSSPASAPMLASQHVRLPIVDIRRRANAYLGVDESAQPTLQG